MYTPYDIEEGFRQSYMDKNLFILGLEKLVNNGFKIMMDDLKNGVDNQDFWKLGITIRSVKEIADYHGAKELLRHSSKLKAHSDKSEINHIYPIYTRVARELFLVRRALIKYLRENKGIEIMKIMV